jgi:hypothetical protein
VKLQLTFGNHVGHGRLSPEQQAVFERLARDEISPEEARKLLGGSVRLFDFTFGAASDDDAVAGPESAAPASAELSEDEIARRLVEQIAQQVDAEDGD